MSPGMDNEGFVHVAGTNGAMDITNGNGALNGHSNDSAENGESHVLVVGAGPAGLMLA